ncbi:hypothetical protein ZYGR_0AD04940 [Zygosaccharomyces rouxii]|uniref:ZYRO0G17468p n=2 Tax=Zygosaccharomyces rouxii TaxID=4956 RepID=C5E124_ZYGRC|nr:uncharacterized protein ZYRO0G17468g [Zygosaccharomyces rouxii]KAH9202801.1 hypothetical protein LQ764DRAFT_232893 [Zygosaccharomyces rouxii]GAV51311.1 hypothetical protein ZYGR_0AD04940 [Zygosaccharomyces rouxii]CAR29808.1 ZYRO0G17468p [Zygosaccharomyces rouxii]
MTLNGSMDSLLKEIDDGMENSSAPEWKLPLQDIGDETMEMLVDHNTKENESLQQRNKINGRKIAGSGTSSPFKKTVDFSEGVDLHEYTTTPEEFATQLEQYPQDVDTRWKRSRPKQHPQQLLPPLPVKEESEDEVEVEEEPELTIDELREHGLQDTSAKLSNVLDSTQNMHQLKQMTQDVDTRATQVGQEFNQRKLSLALQPTQQLTLNTRSDDGLEGEEDGKEEEDEEDEYEYEEEKSPITDASPSRIPLVNTVDINNFNLANVGRHSRVSSGSSYAGSASDLETTTINDRYKLLEYNGQIPAELRYKPSNDNNVLYSPPRITKHPNPSNTQSFTTDYESAKETVNGSTSDLASENREASVENLDIPSGIREVSPVEEQVHSADSSQHDDTLREEDYKSSNTTDEDSDQSRTLDTDEEESRSGIEYTDLHEVSSSYASEGTNEHAPQAECSRLTEDLNASIAPVESSRVSSGNSQVSQGSNTAIKIGTLKRLSSLKARGPHLPPLIPVVGSDPIFNEDPFEEVFDSSGDSLDLTRSVKPSDYISIWHSQADDLKSHSPTISANSQFSQRSVSSQSSTNSAPHSEFRFKPRIVSRSRYYNPENRVVIPSDSDDDDVIYAVDRAMDPRSRNTLISKQLRNSLRNNQKSNPLRLAALGLQTQVITKEEDDEHSPFDNYPITLAPVGNNNIAQREVLPEVKREADPTSKFDELERDSNAEPALMPDAFEFQSYEHLAALANTPEVNHVEVPQSSHVEKDESIIRANQSSGKDKLPAFSPKYAKGRSPVVIPPRSAKRNTNTPVLTPPPKNINREVSSPTLAPASGFYRLGASPLGFKSARENNSAAFGSFTNEYEFPPAPLATQTATKQSPEGSQRNTGVDELLIKEPEELDIRSSLPDSGLADDLGHYFEALSFDDHSASESMKMERGGYNIWNEEYDLIESGNRKSSVPSEVLNRLLESETGIDKVDTNQSRNSESSQGYIKTPMDDVFIGRGLSVNGLEAVVSNEEASERNSVLFDEFHDGNLYQTPIHSPMSKVHVRSPFKAVSPSKSPVHEIKKTQDKQVNEKQKVVPRTPPSLEALQSEALSDSTPDLEPDSKLEDISKPVNNSTITEEAEEETTEDLSGVEQDRALAAEKTKPSGSAEAVLPEEVRAADREVFPDSGTLYLKLKGISGIMLHGVKRRKAQFALEFDNGKNVAQSPWQPMTENGYIDLNREFEVLLDKNPKNQGKIIMTLKCRYEKIVYEPEVEEVIERVPITSKKKLFGKKKEHYQYEKKLVTKPPKEDEWEYIFARDGSFGRCELVLDKDFLDHARFQVKTIKLDVKNEWARQYEPSNKKPHQLPRRAPYIIGKLKLDTCYLSRSSALEKFPKSLAIALGIMSKYESQQSISKEGYLIQEGGDLGDDVARRFFKLQGNKLIGYHEVTRKAKIIVNLLKVSDVVGPTDINNETFNEDPGAQSCFHLVFSNKETITFDTEFSTDEKYDWYLKVKSVVDLNKSHQPWVKAFHESFIVNSV